MDSVPAHVTIAGIIQSLNASQFALFQEAMRAAGGQVDIDPAAFLLELKKDPSGVQIDLDGGFVVVRLFDED